MKRRKHIHSSKLNTDSSFSCCRQWQHRLQDRLPIIIKEMEWEEQAARLAQPQLDTVHHELPLYLFAEIVVVLLLEEFEPNKPPQWLVVSSTNKK